MGTQVKRSKRQHSDEEDDCSLLNQDAEVNFPRFLVVQAENKDKQISNISPFVIEKQISSIIGTPKSMKILKNGNLLVEIVKKQQSDNLLKTSQFFNEKVTVFAHQTLNFSRGVVRCPEISKCSLEEIKRKMKREGVTDVKRISTKKNGQKVLTNTYIFTFNTPTLPKQVKVSFFIKDVEVYIPNPLQCFRCQKFGHHENGCRAQEAVCGRCAEVGHTFENCKSESRKCSNCHKDHYSSSRICSYWKKEKEILRIKHVENLSFFEARKIYDYRTKLSEQSKSNTSYANVTKSNSNECTHCQELVDKLCLLFPDKVTEIRQLAKPSGVGLAAQPPSVGSAAEPSSLGSAAASIQVPPKTPERSQSSKKKQPEQQKQIQKDTPKEKVQLDEKSINRNSKDKKRNKEQKKRINRYVVEDNEVSLPPIPSSPGRFGALSDMEEDASDEDSSSGEIPRTGKP